MEMLETKIFLCLTMSMNNSHSLIHHCVSWLFVARYSDRMQLCRDQQIGPIAANKANLWSTIMEFGRSLTILHSHGPVQSWGVVHIVHRQTLASLLNSQDRYHVGLFLKPLMKLMTAVSRSISKYYSLQIRKKKKKEAIFQMLDYIHQAERLFHLYF